MALRAVTSTTSAGRTVQRKVPEVDVTLSRLALPSYMHA